MKSEKELSDYVLHSMKYLGLSNVKHAYENYTTFIKERKHDHYLAEEMKERYIQYLKEEKK